MHQLSVVIITFNEERNIARCIDSVMDVADEILVVDSFSTDHTETISREKGARFIQRKWDDYSSQKNFANSQAQFQYILSIDADEALSEELKISILDIKKNPLFDAYSMNRLTNYCGKWIHHCSWYPDRKLRLFNRDKGCWNGLIHEVISMDKDARFGFLHGDLLHYSYYTVEDHIRQANKFSEISAITLYEAGKKTNPIRVWFSFYIKFFRDYVVHRGFLDGKVGYDICLISAKAARLKYTKLLQLRGK